MKTLELNREGNKALTGQKYPGAMEKYLEALRYDPFVGQLHLNLGLSFEGLQQAEKALQSYREAEKLALADKNFELVFMARFNQAQLLGKAKQVDEALAVYQKALEIIPSSKEVKTNIELLTQQQQGQGGGEGKQDQPQNGDKNQQQQNQDGKDPKEGDKDQEQKEGKTPQQSQKYKPRPFNGKELTEGDVKKILGELKQQEEKIRAEYNRKDVKEQPRDKDW
ncbi:tetratricopeptide repeat protein [Bdellovibrio bacteriovorus]|uniref:tetratricopeptide repeat protein n=1 Tax=Bdellovibrio bacteriovorus TaxID=959 RepID=UPI001E6472B0|nr:tetratricopeptide repeat protein [Bdellovibrio bacteriovorus]